MLSYGFLAFNNWPILKRTLESAKKLKHTQGPVQWVIVDNSTKEFHADMQICILKWCIDNPDLDVVTIFNGGENTGEGGGMNQCFNACTGDHILFFQDDWECVVNYPFVDLAIETVDTFSQIFMVHLSQRDWDYSNKNIRMGRVLMKKGDMVVSELQHNGLGNNTFQVKLLRKDDWIKVGPYLTADDINFNRYKPDVREGSIGELDYGVRLAKLDYRAAKINTGQFIHTIPENARSEHFITNG